MEVLPSLLNTAALRQRHRRGRAGYRFRQIYLSGKTNLNDGDNQGEDAESTQSSAVPRTSMFGCAKVLVDGELRKDLPYVLLYRALALQ